jgi:two-component system NtrC family sensor kinase
MRRGVKRSKAKLKAKRPVARKSPKREASTRGQLEKALAEALEQQTATAEILRAMSGNPSDLAPVLDTIAKNAARVCGAQDATVHLLEAERLRLVAHHGPVPVIPAGLDMPLSRGLVGGRAVLDREPVHVLDLSQAADFPEGREFGRQIGFKTCLAVPLVREGVGIGVVTIRRVEAIYSPTNRSLFSRPSRTRR